MGAAQRLEGVVLRAVVPGGWDGATGIEAAQLVAKEWCWKWSARGRDGPIKAGAARSAVHVPVAGVMKPKRQ